VLVLLLLLLSIGVNLLCGGVFLPALPAFYSLFVYISIYIVLATVRFLYCNRITSTSVLQIKAHMLKFTKTEQQLYTVKFVFVNIFASSMVASPCKFIHCKTTRRTFSVI
jgi:hypothetical protein